MKIHNRSPTIKISIHALREEGDSMLSNVISWDSNFYPRPPRGGRQRFRPLRSCPQVISIHALREEGDDRENALLHLLMEFLSTPSARRATSTGEPNLTVLDYFYPRPPRGGRPAKAQGLSRHISISIHALREEGDAPTRIPM